MTTATSPTSHAPKSRRSLSIFEWMQKYAKPIFLLCFLSLFGFGAWGYFYDRLYGSGERNADAPPDVIATYELNGKKHDIGKDEYFTVLYHMRRGDIEENGPAALASIIRKTIAQEIDSYVSDKEFKDCLNDEVKEKIKQSNDGKYDEKKYGQMIAAQYGWSIQEFESRLKEDLRLLKAMRELDRIANPMLAPTTTGEIYDQFMKQFSKVKVRGFFASTDQFKEKAKLETEKVEDQERLTAAAKAKLAAWLTALPEDKKKRFRKGGASLTAEGIGFRLAGKSDADLDAEFSRTSPLSQTTLAKLTEEFTPTPADLEKLKRRFGRLRDVYGLAADVDVEKEFVARQNRLVQEWKIGRLLKQIHTTLASEIAAGKEVDLKALAEKSNVVPVLVTNMSVGDLMMKHPEYAGGWVAQLAILKDGELLNWNADLITPQSLAFDRGPVDEFGKHVSIWRLKSKNENPEVVLDDVLPEAQAEYEKEEALKLRDAAFKAFEDKMDAHLTEKTRAFADQARVDAEKAIADETKGLDPEADKARIESIKTARNADADARITAEKAKYRGEAFDAAFNDASIAGIRDTQGFFRPQSVYTEVLPPKDTATVEEKATAALRRDFQAHLFDQPQSEKYVAAGTVSPAIESTSTPGLKGIAKLVEKKTPTIEEMFDRPQEMQQAEQQLMSKAYQTRGRQSLWDFPTMKRVFKLESAYVDKEIAKSQQQKREIEELKNEPVPVRPQPKPMPQVVPPQSQPSDSQPATTQPN